MFYLDFRFLPMASLHDAGDPRLRDLRNYSDIVGNQPTRPRRDIDCN